MAVLLELKQALCSPWCLKPVPTRAGTGHRPPAMHQHVGLRRRKHGVNKNEGGVNKRGRRKHGVNKNEGGVTKRGRRKHGVNKRKAV